MAFTYAGQYGAEQLITTSGVPAPDTPVNVYEHGTQTPATLYTDRTKATGAANPVTTDQYGNLLFYADPGVYDLVANSSDPVVIHVDPDPADVGTGGGGAVASVNGQTGTVVLAAADVGADATGAATAAVAAIPTDGAAATGSLRTLGTGAQQAAAGNDSRITGAAQKASNLSDLANAATARTNLGLGTAATQASTAFDAAGAAAAAQAAAIAASQPVDTDLTAIAALSTTAFGRALLTQADAAALRTTAGLGTAATHAATDFDTSGAAAAAQAASQPLDTDLTAIAALSTTSFGRTLLTLADATAMRTTAGLGGAATLNVGTAAGTVAAGDDSRITGAAQKANNLSDLADAPTSRTNLGLLDKSYWHVPIGWGANWRAARAAAGSRLVKIGVIGDSIAIGWTSPATGNQPAWMTTGWVGLLRSALQTAYGDGGLGFVTVDYMKNSNNNALLGTPWYGSTTGNWTRAPDSSDNNTKGGVNWCEVENSTSGTGAMTIPLRGTSSAFVLARTDPTFGSYSWQINTGGTTTVPLNVAASILKTNLSGLVSGTWNLNLSVVSGTVALYGAAAYNATGIVIDNLSHAGRKTADLMATTTGTSSNANDDTAVQFHDYDLLIFATSVNDLNIAGPPAIATNLMDTYSAIANRSTNRQAPDAIFMITDYEVGVPGFGDYRHLRAYAASEMYKAAQSVGAAVVDIWAYAGRGAEPWNTSGYQVTGQVHPTATGHQQYLNAIQPLITL